MIKGFAAAEWSFAAPIRHAWQRRRTVALPAVKTAQFSGATMKDTLFHDDEMEAITAFGPSAKVALPLTIALQESATRSAGPAVFRVNAPEPPSGWYALHGKRLLDLAFVILTLPVSLPVILICALALWVEGGQPFYFQERLGKGGRRFRIVKLRTMARDADAALARYLREDPALRAEWDRTQKLKNDPRITTVGAILRSTSLDELPQLWNVATGDMSVVGPRPMMPDQLPMYTNPRPYFGMRPGITGEWQVSDRNENSFAHRSTVDARYFARLSLLADLNILFRTVGVVLRQTGY